MLVEDSCRSASPISLSLKESYLKWHQALDLQAAVWEVVGPGTLAGDSDPSALL